MRTDRQQFTYINEVKVLLVVSHVMKKLRFNIWGRRRIVKIIQMQHFPGWKWGSLVK